MGDTRPAETFANRVVATMILGDGYGDGAELLGLEVLFRGWAAKLLEETPEFLFDVFPDPPVAVGFLGQLMPHLFGNCSQAPMRSFNRREEIAMASGFEFRAEGKPSEFLDDRQEHGHDIFQSW